MTLINIDVTEASCRICGIPLVDLVQMRSHLFKHNLTLIDDHPDGVIPFALNKDCWKCMACGRIFNNFLHLYGHMNSHYQHYVCDICGKGFMTAYRLRKHLLTHEFGSFSCDICGQKFTSRAGREYHKNNVHSKLPRYECPKCNMRFKYFYERMQHLNAEHHEKEVSYSCTRCELTFKTSSKRAAHMRSVHLPPQQRCSRSQCTKKYKSNCAYKTPATSQIEEFNCEVCGKMLSSKSSLQRHLRVHEKLNCELCGQFIHISKLLKHMKERHFKITDVSENETLITS